MADDESIELPQQLAGDWRVVDHKFGSGGQGRAVLIERSDATRGVLKLARLDEAIDRARFAREVGILTSIDHSSIVKLLASSAEDGWYVTTAGLPLRRFWGTWCQGRHVNEIFDLALSFGRQLLDGLSLFHARGGVHRDIKPENVIVAVDPSPRPVLIDFGIANEHDDDRLTETRGRLVASNFASPAEALYRARAADGPMGLSPDRVAPCVAAQGRTGARVRSLSLATPRDGRSPVDERGTRAPRCDHG